MKITKHFQAVLATHAFLWVLFATVGLFGQDVLFNLILVTVSLLFTLALCTIVEFIYQRSSGKVSPPRPVPPAPHPIVFSDFDKQCLTEIFELLQPAWKKADFLKDDYNDNFPMYGHPNEDFLKKLEIVRKIEGELQSAICSIHRALHP